MLIGEVIGNVWATKKYDGLDGLKFLIVKTEDNKRMVAFDSVGAGIGEKVIISTWSGCCSIWAPPSCCCCPFSGSSARSAAPSGRR